MNATPPEANNEYSRAAAASPGVSRVRSDGARTRASAASGIVSAGILGAGLVGALMLLVAEFTTLFEVHLGGTTTTVRSVATGSHHSYAIALIAVCAAALTIVSWRTASRPGLIAIGTLGVTALVIAVVVDLPDATASGLVLRSSQYVNASATPSSGFYLETLGAVLLMFAAVWGLLLVGPQVQPGPPAAKEARAGTPVSSRTPR